jgi:hypothetical protein
MKAVGPGCLLNLEAKPQVQRYQWEKVGHMIHLETK